MDVLLVEDDTVLSAQLASSLDGFGHRVTVVGDGQAALATVAQTSFDAIVLDRMLPVVDGLSVLARLRQQGIGCPIILLTALGRLVEKVEGLDGGADEYLVKPVDPIELNARLSAARRGREWAAPQKDTITVGDIVVSPASHRAWRAGEAIDLSKVEFGILTELARNAGAVVTREMLYERLWGPEFVPTTNLAEAHMRRLRQKLMAGGQNDPILTVRGVGYKIKG